MDRNQKKFALSQIVKLVEHEIATNPDTPDRSCVDIILRETLGFSPIECGDEADHHFRLPLPAEIDERYYEHYAEWQDSGNFPWKLKLVNIDGVGYYLGYVSDTGLLANPKSPLFDRFVYLYRADQVDVNA